MCELLATRSLLHQVNVQSGILDILTRQSAGRVHGSKVVVFYVTAPVLGKTTFSIQPA
jgi:hypothetical protein